MRGPHTFRALGDLRPEQLQHAADRHDLGRVTTAEPLGGAYGNNLKLTTDRGAWVLRGGAPPLDVTMLRRERFFARVVRERSTVASPWPYLIDESSDIFGWPYAVMPRLPGHVLHFGLDVRWPRIGAALGRVVADLHRITFPDIGEWDADRDAIVAREVSPADWFLARVQRRQDRVAETSSLDAESAYWVDDLVSAGSAAIGAFEPTYVHGDLGIGNFVGETTSAGFTFTGVFDLGGGYAGDPDEDLAIPLWWPLYWRNVDAAHAFFDSYRAEHPARPDEADRLRAYVAISLLSNWEAGHRRGHDWYGGCATFREWAEPLLEQVDGIVR
jgi:aminoglycoside phosphotransferase (APT) family kinase protein